MDGIYYKSILTCMLLSTMGSETVGPREEIYEVICDKSFYYIKDWPSTLIQQIKAEANGVNWSMFTQLILSIQQSRVVMNFYAGFVIIYWMRCLLPAKAVNLWMVWLTIASFYRASMVAHMSSNLLNPHVIILLPSALLLENSWSQVSIRVHL